MGLPTFFFQIYFFLLNGFPLPFANLSFLLSKLKKYLVGTEARQYVEQIHSNMWSKVEQIHSNMWSKVEQIHSNMWSKVEQIHSDKLLTFPVPRYRVQNHPNSKSYNNFVDKKVLC